MKDPVFGEIDWTGGYWQGTVTLPYFRGFGRDTANIYQDPFQPPDPFGFDEEDEDELDAEDARNLKKGTMELLVTPAGGERLKPTDAQHRAWKMVLGRRDAVWDELMGRLLEAYRRQRPARVRRWHAVFGDHALDRMIPDVKNARALKKLIRPFNVIAQPHAVPPAATPDVLVQFIGAWTNSGFAAVLRDGRVADFVAFSVPDREKDPIRFQHPAFGLLRWNDHYAAWIGDVRWDGLDTFARVAPLRAAFEADRARFRNPTIPEDWFWEVFDGRFTTLIHVNEAGLPTARQVEAWEAFRGRPEFHAGMVRDAVFDYHARTGAAPRVRSVGEMRENLDVATVHLFPGDAKDAEAPPPTIGIEFYGPGDTAFGVRFRDGKVEAVGNEEVAQPRRRKDAGKRPVLPRSEAAPAATHPAGAPPAAGANRVTLRLTVGTSDKVYQAEIMPKGKGHVVNYAFGRHGAKVTTGTKTPRPVPLARAREIFHKLVSEKTARGYRPQPAAGAAPARAVPPTPPPPRGKPAYSLKVVEDGPDVGLEVKSPHLDPALHPAGVLAVTYYEDPKDPIDRKDPQLDPFEEATIHHYLRNQASIRAKVEEALAADQEERGADHGEPVRGDVWSWAELLYFRFDRPNPRRKHVPKVAFHLVFRCAWEGEHHVVAEFEDDKLKPVTIE